VIRGSRHLLGTLDPKRLQVLLEARDVPSGEAREVRVGLLGELDDPIVDRSVVTKYRKFPMCARL